MDWNLILSLREALNKVPFGGLYRVVVFSPQPDNTHTGEPQVEISAITVNHSSKGMIPIATVSYVTRGVDVDRFRQHLEKQNFDFITHTDGSRIAIAPATNPVPEHPLSRVREDKFYLYLSAVDRRPDDYFSYMVDTFSKSDIASFGIVEIFETGSDDTSYLDLLKEAAFEHHVFYSDTKLSSFENWKRKLSEAAWRQHPNGIITTCDDVVVRPDVLVWLNTLLKVTKGQYDMVALFYPYPITEYRRGYREINIDTFYGAIFHWLSPRAVLLLNELAYTWPHGQGDDEFIRYVFKYNNLKAIASVPDYAEHIGRNNSPFVKSPFFHSYSFHYTIRPDGTIDKYKHWIEYKWIKSQSG